MTIQCNTLADMAILISQFVREGLTFDADTKTMSIILTGGY